MNTEKSKLNKKILHELVELYAEVEFNATEDTLFERMVLVRLRDFIDKHSFLSINEQVFNECAELRKWVHNGGSFESWHFLIRDRRLKSLKELK